MAAGRRTEQDDAADVDPLLNSDVVDGAESAGARVALSVVKMKLSTFSKNERLRKVIDSLVIQTNRLVGEAYAFSNFHILRILTDPAGDVPKMDRNFFYRCLVAVAVSDSRPSLLGPELTASVAMFDALRSGDAASKVDIRGRSQLVADISIVMATMATNHLWMNLNSRILSFLRIRHPALKPLHRHIVAGLVERPKAVPSTLFDVGTERGASACRVLEELRPLLLLPSALKAASRAHLTLPLYRMMLHAAETSTSHKRKTFSLLPTKGGFTTAHIPVSSMMFMAILKATGLEKFKGDGRAEDHRALWSKYFNLNAVETRNRRFGNRIITDGYSVSVQMDRLTSVACDVSCGCMDKEACRRKLAQGVGVTRAVGVDPGFTDAVTVAEKGEKPRSFSSALYYEKAKFNRSARSTSRWNAETEQEVSEIPTHETASVEAMTLFVQGYIPLLPQLLGHRFKRGYRAMRFMRYVNRTKTIDAICEFIAPKGKFTVVMFGDWAGGHGSPISRKASGPLQDIKFRLREAPHVDLRSVHEHLTSVTCSKCWGRLTNQRAMTTRWNRRTRVMETTRSRIHKVLHCSNSVKAVGSHGALARCGTTWNRDVNASRNILRLGIMDVLDVPRPDAFCRKTDQAGTQTSSRGGSSGTLQCPASTGIPVEAADPVIRDAPLGRSDLSTSVRMQILSSFTWGITCQ